MQTSYVCILGLFFLFLPGKHTLMKKLYTLLLLCLFTAATPVLAGDGLPGCTDGDPVIITRFYPNPASSIISFEFQKSLDRTSYILQVYSFSGKKMTELSVNDSKLSIPLDNYYRGLYVYQLRDKSGNIIESGKFQVVK